VGERLVIDTKLPLGDANSIQKFLKTNTRLAVLEVTSDKGSNLVSIKATPSQLNCRLTASVSYTQKKDIGVMKPPK